ncbi:Pr6Pr family membrane protein [Herbiconiux sp. L3-i23]|uniref:Pr6Pr family membrane protein n=1 Tax=Herbiconiux sp. L3-i23 TaxID=2905871 RepID=UPI0020546ADC|nr:Pr6Pr family membrane protein [Herbiconiux sp. L3-i23]BDI23213.1 hypothetical protein L3i23_19890 [Herbiconiux sp. L3-i23]
MRVAVAAVRALLAIAIVAAIIGQINTSVGYWQSNGLTDLTSPLVSFFSFFTVQSNVLTIGVMAWGAARLFRGRTTDSRVFLAFRVADFTYMAITGIVYNLLLRGIALPQGTTLEWSNEVFHVVAPLVVVLDWLFAPGRSPVRWQVLPRVLVFPIVWVVYTLIRGPLTPDVLRGVDYWYPYPFLNPNLSHNGYLSVAFYVVIIALVIASLAALAIWISRRFAGPAQRISRAAEDEALQPAR